MEAVDLNPMVRVTLPRLEKREPKALEKSNVEWFLDGAAEHDWLHMLLLLDAATGCRRGELLALTWPDIDFEVASLSTSKALVQTQAKWVFLKMRPKGRKNRHFSLSPSVLEALKRYRTGQNEQRSLFGPGYRTDLDLIFCAVDGNYLKPDSVTAKVSLLARKL